MYLTHYLLTDYVYVKYVGYNLTNSRHPCVYASNFLHMNRGALFCAKCEFSLRSVTR